MKNPQLNSSDGFALLIFLILLMGIGGIALAGFSQNALKSVEKSRFEHNKRVLLEAKQALLLFAYNYSVSNPPVGPGRLPCPDDDNDGLIGAGVDTAQCNSVGRLPALDPRLNFYDARDAGGNRLWYAVSEEFRNFNPADVGDNSNGDDSVNSDSVGTISIFDQAGNLLFDGSTTGVAAVIIAPGSTINNQDRNVTNGDNPSDTIPDTDPGIINPANYLDSLNAFDNSSFVNGGSADAEGFILGPITDQSIEVINDQIIIITAEEVIAMAEKATLQAYRESINNYRANIASNNYPWLDSYTTDNLGEFDADINARIGRVPSIFSEYYVQNTNVSEGMESDVRLRNISYTPSPPVPLEFSIPATNVGFDGSGNLSADFDRSEYYLWDEAATPNGWEFCPFVTGTVNDCNQSAPGVFVADPNVDPNLVPNRVIKIYMTGVFPGTNTFTLNYSAPANGPIYFPPTSTGNAVIWYQFRGSGISSSQEFRFEYDDNNMVPGGLVDETYWTSTETVRIGIRYYPSLPAWVLDNDWHNTVQMAYAAGFTPGSVPATCTVGANCLTVDNQGGVTDNVIALLALASAHNIEPDNGVVGFQDDLAEIFEGENNVIDDIFDTRPAVIGQDDVVLVLDER